MLDVMPQTDRDAALVRHLATMVMGWHESAGMRPNWWRSADGCEVPIADWNPLSDTTLGRGQAMEVMERFTRPIAEAQEGEFWLDGLGFKCCEHDEDGAHGRWRCWVTTECDGDRIEHMATSDSLTRAICEAVARATGFKEAKDAD